MNSIELNNIIGRAWLNDKELIARLEHENEIMRNALIHINCESINAEGLSLAALEKIIEGPNVIYTPDQITK
jgi:hypothetical protein